MQEKLHTQIRFNNGKSNITLKLSEGKKKMYEFLPADDLYDMIHTGIPLEIEGKCILGFSMKAYREKFGIPSDSVISVNFDSIINCLFVGENETSVDFTYCKFVAQDELIGIMFEDNIFYNGKVDFSYCDIGDQDFSLKGSRFIKCGIAFAYTEFGNKDVYFNETIFEDSCEIQFTGTNFGNEGEISFRYMKGVDAACSVSDGPQKKSDCTSKVDSKIDFYKATPHKCQNPHYTVGAK